MGCFLDNYVSLFPCGIVRKEKEILAFTTIWQTQRTEEVSVDLMRYLASAPAGIMDYLFIKMILWAKEQRYARFNLGMAPFSGIESRSLGPLWNRLGSLLFKYGENFYNFHGLRQYKDKFDPIWLPKYLAAPRGFALPWILRDLSTLISGGMKGIFSK
jgi:phosphatidylglycerol lysyltransferase